MPWQSDLLRSSETERHACRHGSERVRRAALEYSIVTYIPVSAAPA